MLGQTHPFHGGEGHPLSRVFICIKQLACCYLHMLQAGFLRWTGLLKTPLLIGTLADLPKGKFELVAEAAPFTIGYTFENKPHNYLPDVVGTLANGKPFIAEVLTVLARF